MKRAINRLHRFLSDEAGMETVEWAILAAMIVAGVAAVIATVGKNILAQFTALQNETPSN